MSPWRSGLHKSTFTDAVEKLLEGYETLLVLVELLEQLDAPEPGQVEEAEEVLEGHLVLLVPAGQVLVDEAQDVDLLGAHCITQTVHRAEMALKNLLLLLRTLRTGSEQRQSNMLFNSLLVLHIMGSQAHHH